MTLGLLGFGMGLPEILILVVVVLLLFGPSKLPQLGEGIGKMLRGFKKEMKALDDDRAAEKKAEPSGSSTESKGDRDEIDVTPTPSPSGAGDEARKTG